MKEANVHREACASYDQDTGYIANIDSIRDREYPMLKETIYLDHAGTTPYPKSLIEDFSKVMTSNLFGNPHSASTSSQLSSRRIDDCRLRVLHFFRASPEDFDVIFTANTTAAIKLVADAFRDHEDGFWYGYHAEAHTSMVGARELASYGSKCFRNDQEMEEWISSEGIERHGKPCNQLLAYPAQSNMTGRRLPLDWCSKLRRKRVEDGRRPYTLLDAAGLVSTTPLDLSDSSAAPDFTVLSFYKMFGFPDLGALIVRKASNKPLMKRKYFGGGTVNMTILLDEQWHDKRKSSLHSRLEDGTVPFHSIVGLECAFKFHIRLFASMEAVSRHTSFLRSRLIEGLMSLRHFNGRKACEIYGDCRLCTGGEADYGATVALNLRNHDGEYVAKTEVEKLAAVRNIQFRTGGLCNPGGVALHLNLSSTDLKKHFAAGQRCGDDNDIIDGRPTGVIRVSLGACSNIADVDTFLRFVEEFYVEKHPKLPCNGLLPPTPPPTPSPPEFYIESLSVFPIKSCAAFEIPCDFRWKVTADGLAWDREWCLVHQGTGTALSQKRFPRMTLLKPYIDFDRQILRVEYSETTSKSKTLEVSLSREKGKDGLTDFSNCVSSTTSKVCGDDMTVQIYTSSNIAEYFSSILEVPCTLARHSPASSRPPKSRLTPAHPTRPPPPHSASMPGSYPSSPPASSSQPSLQPQRLIFSNESPILLVSRSSVNQLNDVIAANFNAEATSSNSSSNSELPPPPPPPPKIPTSAFRGNIVIAATSPPSLSSSSPSLATNPSAPSATAFAEESWTSIHITPSSSQTPPPPSSPSPSQPSSSSLTLTVLGPCQRCQMVCIDQATGARSSEPFSTLAKTRRRQGGGGRVWFGMHLGLGGRVEKGEEGTVGVGDRVFGVVGGDVEG